jgi:signal transduction histidine kinase/CheY-like chemotaxis protein
LPEDDVNVSFLATTVATARERRFAWGVVIVSVALFALALPYAKVKLIEVPAFMPAYISALIVISLVTAVMLVGQFVRLRSLPLLALCAAYLFDAGIAVPYLMSFPGVFAPNGIIGGGGQTTAWLYTFWHAGMPLFVIAYAVLDGDSRKVAVDPVGVMVGASAFVAVVILAMAVASTTGHDLLPPMMVANQKAPAAFYILGSAWLFSGAALIALWRKGIRTSLDVWIAVVMVAWICDVALAAVFNGGRYDLGYYFGRLYGLLAISFVLGAMLLETAGLHGRVVATAVKLSDAVKETEAQLRHAQKMEAIGNLTGGMAHDFNNLLAVVIGNLDLLVAHKKDDREVQQLGGEALDAALRGADLTRHLLAFARRQPLQPKRVDLNELVGNITRLLTRTLGESIEISLDLDPRLWPVVIDPAQLDASLTNLATNARDAMPNGGSLIVVTGNRHLDADYAADHAEVVPGDYAMIEVSDTGAGMDPETAARIFEPFFTTKANGKGTGLGLSMVFGFMKQSGGHINVYSEVSIGTTFRLYLPRADAATSQREAPVATAALEGHGETVLAVEDNASLRRVVARQLHELGYRVLEAESAAAAIAVLEKARVDLLFTDVVMSGGMSGIDLADQARRRWPETRVLVTSGFPDAKFNGNRDGTGRGRLPVVEGLLNKPYRKEDLARAIREALGG